MRLALVVWLGVALLLGSLACSPGGEDGAVPAEPDPEQVMQDVLAAHEAFVSAYENADVDAMVSLLDAAEPTMVFHPLLENRYDGIEEIRQGLAMMFGTIGDPAWTEAHPKVRVTGDAAWLTYHVIIESQSMENAFVGRGTEIWVRTDDGFRLAHAHWSTHPDVHVNGLFKETG